MKARFLAILFAFQFLSQCLAVTVTLPDVPEPSLTAEQALAISEKILGKEAAKVILVGMDWCRTSQFQPRYTAGATYPALQKDDGEYYWFVTYIDRKTGSGLPLERQKIREVTVILIRNNGEGSLLTSLRS